MQALTVQKASMPGPSRQIISRHRLIRLIALYYAIAIGWAWIVWAPLVLGADGLKTLSINPSLPILTCIATLGPSLGCFITLRIEAGNWRAIQLMPATRGRWIWVLLGPLLVLLCNFVVFPVFISFGKSCAMAMASVCLDRLVASHVQLQPAGGPAL